MKNIIFLLSILSLITITLNAKNDSSDTLKVKAKYSSTFYTCEKASPNINECLDKELKKQDKYLNVAYQKAIKEIQPFRKRSLKEMQRTWIKYRNQKCTFYSHKESGSGGLTDAIQCELDMTMQRTIELKEIQ